MRGVNVVSNNTELLSVCVYVRVFVATVTAMLEWLVNLFCVHVCVFDCANQKASSFNSRFSIFSSNPSPPLKKNQTVKSDHTKINRIMVKVKTSTQTENGLGLG